MASLIENKKVHFNYEILEKLDAGIELFGFEVKSLRKGQGSLEGSHITVRGSEAFLIGATIPPFQPANAPKGYDQTRTRKLLLTKKEIEELALKEKQKGLTIVPISVYNKSRKLKLSIGIVRGKKKFDKRQSIKKRETDRESRRTLKYE
jgi:SsrA-binding protein